MTMECILETLKEDNMDTQVFYEKFAEGVKMFVDLGNWGFVVAFMVWSWILGMAKGRVKIRARWFRIPTAYWVIAKGVVLAMIWAYLFNYNTKEQFAELFISIIIGMVCWKLGLSKVGAKAEEKLSKK